MLQLKDETPFQSVLAVFPDPDGVDTLYVTTKATFRLGDQPELASEQLPITLADEYWGEPGKSSLKYAGEVQLSKPSTDVALVGNAHSPRGRPVTKLDVLLSVGPVRKVVRVVGDREWTGNLVGPLKKAAKPFKTMPLVWERAYGGLHVMNEEKGKMRGVAANPVGSGFRARRRLGELKGGSAPNLLDPGKATRPACFGFVAAAWSPRISYAGTYDAAWQKKRSPYLPVDFDSRFFNAVSPDLVCPGYLRGGERVKLANCSPRSRMKFDLPTVGLDVRVRVAGRVEKPVANLETVLFEPDDERMSLVWRAALPCDKRTLAVEEVAIRVNELILDGKRA